MALTIKDKTRVQGQIRQLEAQRNEWRAKWGAALDRKFVERNIAEIDAKIENLKNLFH